MKRRDFLKWTTALGAAMSRWDSAAAAVAAPETPGGAMRKAEFIEPPKLIVPHRPEYEFLGPSVIRVESGRLLMAANGYEPGAGSRQGPRAWISSDRGRTWTEPVVIDDQSQRQHIYPSICFLDEEVLVVYSTHFSNNTFGSTPQQKLIGGGKRCIFKVPARNA